MNVSEAAKILCLPRDFIKKAINDGISKDLDSSIKLKAIKIGKNYDISDDDLNDFIKKFFENDLARKIPVEIRRKLLIESSHKCSICSGTSSLEFHHIIDFSKIKNHDPNNMIVLCATCHNRCTNGEIDRTSQYQYKKRNEILKDDESYEFPARFSWQDLSDLISMVHNLVKVNKPSRKSKNDLSIIGIDEKNKLNNMSTDYYEFMRDNHQQYFGRIEEFLREPANENYANLYYEIVDELNAKISASRDKFAGFQDIIIEILDTIKSNYGINKRTLNIFLSFTYFKCDVGRKSASTD